jgi:hypothetical protein
MLGRRAATIAAVAAALVAAAPAGAELYPGAPWITLDASGAVTISEPPAGAWPWDPGMGSDPVETVGSRAVRAA